MGTFVLSPALVGRTKELRILEVARARAANGQPAVVLIGGEAGVGKTRLVAELTAQDSSGETRTLAGGCIPVGEGDLPYAPIVEALRTLLAELGTDAMRGLTGPSWPELARLVPGLGKPKASPPGQASQTRLFELLLGLLGRLAVQVPVTLVVEDLHWADRSTRNLLAFLVRNLRRERVLLVITYRNDEPRQGQLGPYLAELDRSGRVDRMELARLDRAGVVAQVASILGATPDTELVDAIYARSEGNPFFTNELLEAVRTGSGELPTTLRDLLRGRIRVLPEQARYVLEAAVVAGRGVPHQLLARVAGLEDAVLVEALRSTVANQLLVTRPGGDGYNVRHALLREVVDADLLPGERAQLHASYARALAERPQLAGESQSMLAALLAAHWDAAGEPAQALPARVAAGSAAEQAHAFAEAARHYQRALALWAQVPDPDHPGGLDRIGLLTHTAQAMASTGATMDAIQLFEKALDQLDQAVEPVRTAVLLAYLGYQHSLTGDEPAALAAYQQAERLLGSARPSAEYARVLALHAQVLMTLWRGRQASPYCEEAIAVARSVGAPAEEAHALTTLGSCLEDQGEYDEAIGLHGEARRIAERIGDAETVVRSYNNLSFTLMTAGRQQEALAVAAEGLQRAREVGLERASGSALANNLAWALQAAGRWQECQQLTDDVLAGDHWCTPELHSIRSLLFTRRGDFPAAREEIELAEQTSPADRNRAWLGRVELALWEGKLEQADPALGELLHWCAEREPDEIPPGLSVRYPLALRLAADRAERGGARRLAEEVASAQRQAGPIVAELNQLADAKSPQARSPEVVCNLLLARAELSRLEGGSDPELWRTAAVAWEQSEHPFEAAYARFREAEALLTGGAPRARAEAALRPAHQTADKLQAGPLNRRIWQLAQRGRLRLEEPMAAERPLASPAASLGLTRREGEVLALLAEGRTNRQIGRELFIAEKTASLHVSRILAKLGVASRGEAAAVAHRLGLDRGHS
jgi:DNA-binding CsgD family transcriptional regulator